MKTINKFKAIILSSLTLSLLALVPVTSQAVSVTNMGSTEIKVAISTHGAGGGTSDYTIKNNQTEKWNRSADRGNLLKLNDRYYFANHDDNLAVTNEYAIFRLMNDNTASPIKTADSGRFNNTESISNYIEGYNLSMKDIDLSAQSNRVKVQSLVNSYQVSLSRWENGTGDYVTINKNGKDSWVRKEKDGCILTISTSTNDYQYFVQEGESVTILDVTKGEVFVYGVLINPINK